MKIYLCGPIGGRVNRNSAAFEAGAAYLRSLREVNKVVTPLKDITLHSPSVPCSNGKETGFPEDPHRYGCYLVACIRLLATCDGIARLHDWGSSPGARTEMDFAAAAGIRVLQPVIDLAQLEIGRQRLGWPPLIQEAQVL